MRALLLTALLAVLLAPAFAFAQSEGDRAAAKNDEGIALWDEGDLDAAATRFREALVLDARARYYLNLCLVLEAAEDYGPALTACRAVPSAKGGSDELLVKSRETLDRIKRRMRGEEVPEPERLAPESKPDPEPAADPEPEPGPEPGPDPEPEPPPGDGGAPEPGREPAPAPEPPPPVLVYGGKLGLNLARLDGEPLDNASIRPGVAIGGYAVYRFGSHFAMSGELLLTRKGANFDLNMPNLDVDASIELTYVEIPVFARVTLPAAGADLFAEAGASMAFLADASGDVGGMDADLSDQTEFLDLGLLLGAGAGFDVGDGIFELEARYEQGLLDVIESADEPEGQGAIRNRVFSLMAGYLF